jgi:hypothetical protein
MTSCGRLLPVIMAAACLTTCGSAGPKTEELPPGTYQIERKPSEVSAEEANRWLQFYYLHPEPERTVEMLDYLGQHGLINDETREPLISFLAQVFNENPDQVPFWLDDLAKLDAGLLHLGLQGVWFANSFRTREYLEQAKDRYPPMAEVAEKLLREEAPQIGTMEVNSPMVIDILWHAYFANGNTKYIRRILRTVEWLDAELSPHRLTIAGAARWSLETNGAKHERVMKLLRSEQVRSRGKMREIMDEIITKAEALREPEVETTSQR